jgi:hypothetical protein
MITWVDEPRPRLHPSASPPRNEANAVITVDEFQLLRTESPRSAGPITLSQASKTFFREPADPISNCSGGITKKPCDLSTLAEICQIVGISAIKMGRA